MITFSVTPHQNLYPVVTIIILNEYVKHRKSIHSFLLILPNIYLKIIYPQFQFLKGYNFYNSVTLF